MTIRSNLFLLVIFILTVFIGVIFFTIFMINPILNISKEANKLRNLTENTFRLRSSVLAMQNVKLDIQYQKVKQSKELFDSSHMELNYFKYLPELNSDMAKSLTIINNLYNTFTHVWEQNYINQANTVMEESVRIFNTDMLKLYDFRNSRTLDKYPDKESIINKIDELIVAISLIDNNLSLTFAIMSEQFGNIEYAIQEREDYIKLVLINTLVFTIIGLILISIFISARIRKQELELKLTKNYLTNIIESMPSMLIGVDNKCIITQWNQASIKGIGTSKENAIGQPLAEIVSYIPEIKTKVLKTINSKKEIRGFQIEREEKEKSIFEDMTIYPLIGGQTEGAIIKIDDITKQHQMQDQLSHIRKMDAIGQLAGGVAHDFNNMLGAIMGATQLLKSSIANIDSKSLKFLDLILDASTRAADLTSELLTFSRKGKTIFATLNINDIIDDTTSLLSRTINKNINISVVKDALDNIVLGNSGSLQSALMNLGINASHAMTNGGQFNINTKNIKLDKNYCNSSSFDIEPGEYIVIEVRDSGAGISKDILDKIFEPFFTTKEQGKGTGLGLASVYGTIIEHHGAIYVYSEVGTGTAFHIYIPCSQKTILDDKKIDKVLPRGTGKILLVDDEEMIRTTGKYMLEEIGYTVILAANGKEALEIFSNRHNDINLVLMDMIMPEMNGRETFYKMKEIDIDCKVVISSGFTKDEDLEKMTKFGLLGFIAKPYGTEELACSLATILNNAASNKPIDTNGLQTSEN